MLFSTAKTLSPWRSRHISCVNDTSWVHVVAGQSTALTCLWVGNLAGPGDADDECVERGYKCFPRSPVTWYGSDIVCFFCTAYLKKKKKKVVEKLIALPMISSYSLQFYVVSEYSPRAKDSGPVSGRVVKCKVMACPS